MKSIEVQLNEALDNNRFLERQIVSLRHALTQARLEAAAIKRKHILKEAMLEAESITRLERAFTNSTDNAGLKEAINAERRHMRSMNNARAERILG